MPAGSLFIHSSELSVLTVLANAASMYSWASICCRVSSKREVQQFWSTRLFYFTAIKKLKLTSRIEQQPFTNGKEVCHS